MIDLSQLKGFDWDEGNIKKNWFKYKVDFRECEEMFSNFGFKVFNDQTHSQKEDRFVILGITFKNRYLAVVFTVRNNKIRVISARDMSRKERRKYE